MLNQRSEATNGNPPKRTKFIFSLFILLAISLTLWLLWLAPKFTQLPEDFRYKADVISYDNFYDAKQHRFTGPVRSKTTFTYRAVAKQGNVLLIRNIFDVRKLNDERIFTVERLYGINSRSGKHTAGYGDHPRSGYLFAPRHLDKQPFTYWHINYDEPARLNFREETKINGLTVYRYEADYHADQTKNLTNLPGVPKQRSVKLNINLQLWVEPTSGRMVKYEDRTLAYYVSNKTGKTLFPWNRFRNSLSKQSIDNQVASARAAKRTVLVVDRYIPALFTLLILISLLGIIQAQLATRKK